MPLWNSVLAPVNTVLHEILQTAVEKLQRDYLSNNF